MIPLGAPKGTRKLKKRAQRAFRNGAEKSAENRSHFWVQKETSAAPGAPSGLPVKRYILRKALPNIR